jgi:hypothetical protein
VQAQAAPVAATPVAAPTFHAESPSGREVHYSAPGTLGKVRSFTLGFLLSVITFGLYGFFWYYFVNDELKDIGQAKGDSNLANSNPALSVLALFGGWFIVPPLLSVYNYGQRIKRAQRLGGVPIEQQINPVISFLLFFPGSILIIPYFCHFWYVTKHQNGAIRAAAGLPIWG